MTAKSKPVTASEMGRHLGVSRQSATRLAGEGILKQEPSGRFILDENRLAYLAHLRSRKSEKTGAADEYRRLRSREVSLRIGKLEGELMLANDAMTIISELCGLVRTSFGGLPSQCTRDPKMRAVIAEQVDVCLHRLADAAERKAAECAPDAKQSNGGADVAT